MKDDVKTNVAIEVDLAPLDHIDELEVDNKHWIAQLPYGRYFHQTFLFHNQIISKYPIMMYMSYPGFVTIEPVLHDEDMPSDEEIFNQGLHYFNHEFDLIEAQGIKSQHDRLQCNKKLKRIRQERSKNLRTWGVVLNACGQDFYSKSKDQYEVAVKNTDVIVNLNNRCETFYPLCFKENKKIVGGLFANAWQTHPSLENQINTLEFDTFITGGCLFGNEVYGIDDRGKRHPLTNPRHEVTDLGIIQKIEYLSDRHSDEILTMQSLKNIIPLIKTLSTKKTPTIIYHIPECEYILNIFHHYIHNRITTKACLDYIELICMKKREHVRKLLSIAAKADVDIIISSPLDPLIQKLKTEEDIILGLLQLTKLPMLDIFENEAVVFAKLLDYLCEHSGQYKPLWQSIGQQLKESPSDEIPGLNKLSYLSYSANLAAAKLEDKSKRVCCLYPGHEKRIQLTYKYLFGEEWGNVYCINWIPPILIKSEAHHNGIYFINEKLNKRVKNILDLNIADHVYKSIGGIAVDDKQFVLEQMESIFLTLCSVHPREVIYKILKSLIE